MDAPIVLAVIASLFDLQGRVAFVPGGYGDIGTAIARGLALAGARVAVAGRSADKAAGAGGHAARRRPRRAGPGDGCASRGRHPRRRWMRSPRISATSTCWSTASACSASSAWPRSAKRAFDEVLQVNLKAAMFLAQAAARHQVAAVQAGHAPGRQVHILSVRAMLGMRDRGYSAYCATKGALVMLIKQHAVELSAHGICVNGVAPTVVRGTMGSHWLDNPATRDALLQRIPLGRVAEPSDVVGATLLFCSPAAAFVTGQVLYVDGGLTATQ